MGRGYFTLRTLVEINHYLIGELKKEDAIIDGVYICPHRPGDGCTCRKPNTGLIEKAKADFHLDLSLSFMVGDKFLDLETGHKAGCKTVLVLTGYGTEQEKERDKWEFQPDFVAKDLYEAALWIIEQKDE